MASAGDIDRAKKGKAVWNKWAEERRQAGETPTVDFSGDHAEAIDFTGFVFPGQANFDSAVFLHPTSFSGATFLGHAIFSRATFHSDVNLDRINFARDALFEEVRFKKFAYMVHNGFKGYVSFQAARCEHLDLRGSDFHSEANFERAWLNHSEFTGVTFKHSLTRFNGMIFEHVPDFRAVTFKAPPLIQGIDVKYAKYSGPKFWRRWAFCTTGEDDAAKFRRLKQLASDWRDHERELEFFAKELRAKRFHETKTCGAIVLSLAYGWLSNFGQSVARPVCTLAGLTAAAAALVFLVYSPTCAVTAERVLAALWVSLTDWGLLLGADKWEIRHNAFSQLCSERCAFGLRASLLAYLQSAASLFLLFLLGLGLRNRFRTGTS